jgi:tetratricopeptide (TPR) repeat protein
MENPKKSNGKSSADKSKEVPKPAPAPVAPVKVPAMFRKFDWFALLITFGVVWAVYLWTLAPELTLEDSGELCTGSFYAGIPHPPGYPFWAIYSWFWTAILPFGNVAWRVEVGESFAAAMGCGMVALMVSRGSSMLIEGIEDLKGVARRWENAICIVSGAVSGMLLGLGSYMWGESVVINRISLFGVPWLIAVILCLMRWAYAPQQKRYLYVAMLLYGWCATIHQSLLLSVPGIEILIALALPRLGRDLFIWNSLGYVVILYFMSKGSIPALNAMTFTEKTIFHVVGLGSSAAWTGMYLKDLIAKGHLKNDWLKYFWGALFSFVSVFVLFFVLLTVFKPVPDASPDSFKSIAYGHLSQISDKVFQTTLYLYGCVLGVFALINIWKGIENKLFGRELLTGFLMGIVWIVGVCVYLYEPVSCMTDPPMQWGYPRTVEGFFHALSRGQYGVGEGTNLLDDPSRFFFQLFYLADGLSQSFSWAYLFVGLIPFAFLMKMHKRERNWIIGLSAIYFCIAVVLVIMLNVSADRSTADLNEVFFIASHSIFAMMIGYGLTILAAYVAVHYERLRHWCFGGAGLAVVLAFYCLVNALGKLYFGPAGQLKVSWLPFPKWPGWEFLALGPNGQFGFLDIPHWVAQAFAKNQFGLPVFANLILIALPLIFLAALLVYRKRGPVLILLGLFAVTPLCSGLSHWYQSEQRNHWFGYWFGHDMFTPPFTDTTGKLSYDNARRAELMKDPAQAKFIYPEMTRNAIVFGGTDPGRFCPTYMIFCESFIPPHCQPEQDQKFDRRDCYLITQNALADGTYLDYLRAQYNRSLQKDPPFFSRLFKYVCALGGLAAPGSIVTEGIDTGSGDSGSALIENISKLLYNMLDVPFTKWGNYVETYRRKEGVYPPNEIYIPTPEDSQECFQEYAREKQLQSTDNRIQISGQLDVMNINGMLCKVIFDHSPTNEFFVEESFPLDWMYPYETPFGVIMKINHNQIPEMTQEMMDRDHKFWSDYSSRLCGNWITYDTTVQQIADFVDRTYIRNDYTGFTGDRRFVRDQDGQKAFSKLRSSQAGMYAWRCFPKSPGYPNGCSPEYLEKSPALQAALIRETDFAFKQAFAFCPYSPEAVFRYINFLLPQGRFDEAILVAETCRKLDPFNESLLNTIAQLKTYRQESAERAQAMGHIQDMENLARTNPADTHNLVYLGMTYMQMQQTNRAVELFDQAIAGTNISFQDASAVAQGYMQIGSYDKLETALKKRAALAPGQPEAVYDLSALQALLTHTAEALQNLQTALELSARQRSTNPAASDLLEAARSDHRLDNLRSLPEFQKLVPPK